MGLLPVGAHAQAGPGLQAPKDGRARSPALPAVGADEPVVIDADRLSGRPDQETVAEGQVEFRRGPLSIQGDRIEYSQPTDTARAIGNVEVRRDGNTYRGPELELKVQRFEGWFRSPTYFFERTQAGGSAERFDFLDDKHSIATGGTYTSCPAPDPAWVLKTDRVLIDNEADEGTAENAVLRFYGVPILAMPILSFPLSDARKSGWLPPSVNLDSKSGLTVEAPYYWNIAPNRDALLTPTVYSRRGAGLGGEFRYLEPSYRGTLQTQWLPDDRLADRSRWSLLAEHEARWDGPRVGEVDYGLSIQRVSDDNYWKDLPRTLPSRTPRLLPTIGQATRRFDNQFGDTVAYARVQQWQVLQDSDPNSFIVAPYRREPQLGIRQRGAADGFEWRWETEANRFTNENDTQQEGSRAHALGMLARPWMPTGALGWTITPRVSFNAAAYDLDPTSTSDGRQTSRIIPTAALDSTWVFERPSGLFDRDLTQTLEPRLQYVYTPFHRQNGIPQFDSAPLDFNFSSIFAENQFSGVDRVNDADQITAGVTTRFLDRGTGAEALRLGIAQRLLLSDQRITPGDGPPITQRLSDLLLLASTSLVPKWNFDGTWQYNADDSRTQRSVLGARYSPGPFRTIGAAYSYQRDASEQVGVGWQWPLNAPARDYAAAEQAREDLGRGGGSGAARSSSTGCTGAWYTVGRINYSMRDASLTDSIMGFEYDSGCWIGRVVIERFATGNSEATTRLLLQLELVGLSRIGSNPLKVLKDNVPGYRLLRDDAASSTPAFLTP